MTGEPSIQPKLSVVVAAWSGSVSLRRCLLSLHSQVRPGEDEIIVARNFALDAGEAPMPGFPALADIPLAAQTNVPRLRAAGLEVATGVVVAFIEDHCICAPGWRDAIVTAHHLPVDAVGGPVDLATGGRPLDWAVYFYDYSRFAPPMTSGPVLSLSGANMSYKATFLKGLGSALQDGVMEVVLEQESHRRGASIYLAADAVVIHGKRHAAKSAIGLAFALARGYASRRVLGTGALRRFGFACATPILPLIFLARILAATRRAQRKLFQLATALPWLAILLGAWSLGELTGYLAGEGKSQNRWC